VTESALDRLAIKLARTPRDGDGDGLIADGTPAERPAPMKMITIKRHSFDSATIEVGLTPTGAAGEFDVSVKGRKVGRIASYSGSIDRKAGNMRTEGKKKTLWSANDLHGLASRTEAIRRVLR
jgi:hypothetical protein